MAVTLENQQQIPPPPQFLISSKHRCPWLASGAVIDRGETVWSLPPWQHGKFLPRLPASSGFDLAISRWPANAFLLHHSEASKFRQGKRFPFLNNSHTKYVLSDRLHLQ